MHDAGSSTRFVQNSLSGADNVERTTPNTYTGQAAYHEPRAGSAEGGSGQAARPNAAVAYHEARDHLGFNTGATPWRGWSRQDHWTDSGRQLGFEDGSGSLGTPAASPLRESPEEQDQGQHMHQALEHMHAEIGVQGCRQDEVFECIAKLESDLSRVAKLAVENEGLHAAERNQKHLALTTLTRRTEDALLTCESLRAGQEHLVHKVERLEALADNTERTTEEMRYLHGEVGALQDGLQDKHEMFGHALRRLDAMEQVFDENTKLRQEVGQLRRANERRDLEMAAVQGQIDALTKLVREQFKEPHSFEH